MRRFIGFVLASLVVGSMGAVEAKDKNIEDLPKDVWTLATFWTEPIKQVVKDSRQFDPVSGFWFGLVEGSVKSVERTADVLLPPKDKSQPGADVKDGKLLYRYSF